MTATVTAVAPQVPAAPRRRRAVLLVGVIALLVLVGAGAFLLGNADAEDAAAEGPPPDGPVVAVAQLTANLAGSEVHFAKLSFSAVLSVDADQTLVAERFPLLTDMAITELSAMTADHLRTTAGIDELRARLSERATTLYPDGEVLRVILTEMLVQ